MCILKKKQELTHLTIFPKIKHHYHLYIYLADDGLLAVRCRSVEGRVAFDDGLSMVSVLSGIADTWK